MKKTILLLVLSLLVAGIANAQEHEEVAEESCWDQEYYVVDPKHYYAKFFTGPGILQDSAADGNHTQYQTGYIVAVSLGYRWCCGLHLEGEYAFRKSDIEEIRLVQQGWSDLGSLKTSSFMANLLWDLPFSLCCNFGDVQPFVGAGIGYDCTKMNASNSRVVFDQKWKYFSWQLMAGLAYPIFCNTDISLEYKFHQGGSQFCNHVLGVGIDYQFDFLP